jgi:hypothetical protein
MGHPQAREASRKIRDRERESLDVARECEEVSMRTMSAADVNSNYDDSNLDRRYGKIGIPAVAAALAYQSDAKNSAYAPVVPQVEWWLEDLEAA